MDKTHFKKDILSQSGGENKPERKEKKERKKRKKEGGMKGGTEEVRQMKRLK